MCALLHRDRLWIRSVTLDPPASDDGRPWPCPLCGRFQLLDRMRLIQAEQLESGDFGERLLVCLDCISTYNPQPGIPETSG